LLPGQFAPRIESANSTLAKSLPGAFTPWLFRSLAISFPGTLAAWNFRSWLFRSKHTRRKVCGNGGGSQEVWGTAERHRIEAVLLADSLRGANWRGSEKAVNHYMCMIVDSDSAGTSQLVTQSTRHTVKWCDDLTVVSDGVVTSWPYFMT